MPDLDQFIKNHCTTCGTQRCDPKDPIWREGCPYWRAYKGQPDPPKTQTPDPKQLLIPKYEVLRILKDRLDRPITGYAHTMLTQIIEEINRL